MATEKEKGTCWDISLHPCACAVTWAASPGRGLSVDTSRLRSSRSVRLLPGGSWSMSAPFEERSGVVPCGTPWGQWYQTLEEVFIEVQVPPGTRAQDIQCGLQSRHVALAVGGREILKVVAGRGLCSVSSRPLSPRVLKCIFFFFFFSVKRLLEGRLASLAERAVSLAWFGSARSPLS